MSGMASQAMADSSRNEEDMVSAGGGEVARAEGCMPRNTLMQGEKRGRVAIQVKTIGLWGVQMRK